MISKMAFLPFGSSQYLLPPDGKLETCTLYHDNMSPNILIDPVTQLHHGNRGLSFAGPAVTQTGLRLTMVRRYPLQHRPQTKVQMKFHKELRDRLEQILLRPIFLRTGGRRVRARGHSSACLSNKIAQVDFRASSPIIDWANRLVQEGVVPFPTRMGGETLISGRTIEGAC